MHATTFFTTFLLAASPFAVALPASSRVNTNAQSCTATDTDLQLAVYTVTVGVSFNKNVCKQLADSLDIALGCPAQNSDCTDLLNEGECFKTKHDQTGLMFMYDEGHGAPINSALHSVFPSVNRFNCPNY
jgi:hypothetical protein